MLELAEYEFLRHRPLGREAMRQRWRALTFLHFSAGPDEIQDLLPSGLTVDTYPDSSGSEKAWIGLVPFRMEGVTPRGFPEIPSIHAFPETNVRTYVHRDGRKPGVWFFSLDAANALACRVARRFFHLPYHEAAMRVVETAGKVEYSSTRHSDGCRCEVTCRYGDPLSQPHPGSLEFFLVERYLLYSERNEKLFSGRVYHEPYPVRSAVVTELREDLIEAAGIRPREFDHLLFSAGVDVEVFPLALDLF